MDYTEQVSEAISSIMINFFFIIGGGMVLSMVFTIVIDLMKKKSKVR